MKTQQDTKVRTVALENLKAMCARVSGMCHRFEVTKITKNRCYVTYSNPDEYAVDHPMTAVFPCLPGWDGDEENPCVILRFLRVIHDTWDGVGWQAFDVLVDCPTLWRSEKGWRTHKEIREEGDDQRIGCADTCVICDLDN